VKSLARTILCDLRDEPREPDSLSLSFQITIIRGLESKDKAPLYGVSLVESPQQQAHFASEPVLLVQRSGFILQSLLKLPQLRQQ
jgi:hypothetical protein